MHQYSVSDVNRFLKQIVAAEELLYSIRVEGEISNFVYHRSGHMYFTLKDASSSIRCVVFRTHASQLAFLPENGMSVVVQGDVQVFERDGTYQLYGRKIQKQGVGEEAEALLSLAKRLEADGVFAVERKRNLPKFPKSIGVITGENTAAFQDIIKIVSRRYPVVELWHYPAIVQGKNATSSLCTALKTAAKTPPEILIIGRGGGSKEDLSAFQTEEVVRAIAGFPTPVISAIGHEIDTTLADLAADLRAPTPSAAAELATPDLEQIKKEFDNLLVLLYNHSIERLKRQKLRLSALEGHWKQVTSEKFLFPSQERLNFLNWRLLQQINRKWLDATAQLSQKVALLFSVNPLNVLERGYSLAYSSEKELITSIRQLSVGTTFSLRLNDGEIIAMVTEKKNR